MRHYTRRHHNKGNKPRNLSDGERLFDILPSNTQSPSWEGNRFVLVHHSSNYDIFSDHAIKIGVQDLWLEYKGTEFLLYYTKRKMQLVSRDWYSDAVFVTVKDIERPVDILDSNKNGTLFRMRDDSGNALAVRNSTQAKNKKEYDNFLLNVPKHIRVVKEALAWTFNVDASMYNPQIET